MHISVDRTIKLPGWTKNHVSGEFRLGLRREQRGTTVNTSLELCCPLDYIAIPP